MSEKKDGGRAFPCPSSSGGPASEGMSLRDYFAGQALAALLTNSKRGLSFAAIDEWAVFDVCAPHSAYAIADAMLAERTKKEDTKP